jgi:hypothetical protein
VGRKQALADFTGKKAPFADRDLYVFCIGPDRVIAANGGYPSFVGMSADVLKDADGRFLTEGGLTTMAVPASAVFALWPRREG